MTVQFTNLTLYKIKNIFKTNLRTYYFIADAAALWFGIFHLPVSYPKYLYVKPAFLKFGYAYGNIYIYI